MTSDPSVPGNIWLWPLGIAAPLIIFISPARKRLASFATVLFAIAVTHWLLLQYVIEMWDIRADVAFADPNSTNQDLLDATADGASNVFTLLFGWIPATVYVGFWMLIRKLVKEIFRRGDGVKRL